MYESAGIKMCKRAPSAGAAEYTNCVFTNE